MTRRHPKQRKGLKIDKQLRLFPKSPSIDVRVLLARIHEVCSKEIK